MLKKTINDLTDVEEEYRSLYSENGEGSFSLNIEVEGSGVTETDIDGLKRNQQALKAEKLRLKEKLDNLESQLNTKEEQELESKGQYDQLIQRKEQEFKEKLEQADEKTAQATTLYKDSLITTELNDLATELAGDRAKLLMPHLRDRISVDDENHLIYQDASDRESLLKEFKNNSLFAPILKDRDSSGGSANGTDNTKGDTSDISKYFDPSSTEYSPTKQGEIQQENPEAYKNLSSKFGLDDPFNVKTTAPKPNNFGHSTVFGR